MSKAATAEDLLLAYNPDFVGFHTMAFPLESESELAGFDDGVTGGAGTDDLFTNTADNIDFTGGGGKDPDGYYDDFTQRLQRSIRERDEDWKAVVVELDSDSDDDDASEGDGESASESKEEGLDALVVEGGGVTASSAVADWVIDDGDVDCDIWAAVVGGGDDDELTFDLIDLSGTAVPSETDTADSLVSLVVEKPGDSLVSLGGLVVEAPETDSLGALITEGQAS